MFNVLCIVTGSIITYVSTLYFIYGVLKLKYKVEIVMAEMKYNEAITNQENEFHGDPIYHEEHEDNNMDDKLMAALKDIKSGPANNSDDEIDTAENQGE